MKSLLAVMFAFALVAGVSAYAGPACCAAPKAKEEKPALCTCCKCEEPCSCKPCKCCKCEEPCECPKKG